MTEVLRVNDAEVQFIKTQSLDANKTDFYAALVENERNVVDREKSEFVSINSEAKITINSPIKVCFNGHDLDDRIFYDPFFNKTFCSLELAGKIARSKFEGIRLFHPETLGVFQNAIFLNHKGIVKEIGWDNKNKRELVDVLLPMENYISIISSR